MANKTNTPNESPMDSLHDIRSSTKAGSERKEAVSRSPADIANSAMKKLSESSLPLPESIAMLRKTSDQLKMKTDQILLSKATAEQKKLAMESDDRVLTTLLQLEHVNQKA